METQKISLIIPVYKVEAYLKQCVDSALSQTYRNLEIILVDDGSPDRCGTICDAYAKEDERVVVIHKENGGLSDARNAGTKRATGAFVLYLDSDDYLESNAIEMLVSVQEKSRADLVIGNYWYTYSDHEDVAASDYTENITFTNYEAMEALMAGKLQTFAWGKLIKAEIAKKYDFPVGKTFEDHFWTHLVLGAAANTVYVSSPIVHYRQHADSISYSFSTVSLDALDGWRSRKKYLERYYPALTELWMKNCAKQSVNIAWLVLTRMKKERAVAFRKLREISTELHLANYASGTNLSLLKALDKGWIRYAVRVMIVKTKNAISHAWER